MNKNKLLILIVLAIFTVCFSLGSVSAMDNSNSTDSLNVIDDASSVDILNTPEEDDSLSQNDNSNEVDKLAISENSSDEILTLSANSSSNVLSSSVSVSAGHTYHKMGYTFKVSSYQYKKIKEAVKAGKKQKFLDWGFDFTVKTNKMKKVKVLVKKHTYYKAVKYEKFTYTHNIKLVNLNKYYNQGWKKYKAEWHNGYHYAYFKKTVKTYKTVKMRVYANIGYVGEYDYVTGEQAYFPWISFEAKKSGYSDQYLGGCLLTYY